MSVIKVRYRIGLLVMLILLAGCDALIPPEPTATPQIDDSPTLAPSPTILPVAPESEADPYVGRSNPTQAALAAEAQPTDDQAVALLPTQPSIPITVFTPDGVRLETTYYGSPTPPAPVILLLHGQDGDRAALDSLAVALQSSGYHVMVMAMRGYGQSGGQMDWSRAISDVTAALNTIQTLPNALQIAVVGQDLGGMAGASACGLLPDCTAALLIDPLESGDLSVNRVLESAALLPMLVLVSDTNPTSLTIGQNLTTAAQGDQTLQLYNRVLTDPVLMQQIINWLVARVVAP